MKCDECRAYERGRQQCRRYPRVYEKLPHDWCGEFSAKEVVPCPVEEKEKVVEARVEEKAEGEIVKRGWPKGKPRK